MPLSRGAIPERAVGSRPIVVLSPRLNDPSGIGEAEEPVLVQALVSESPVEALDHRVLDGLAWLDEVEVYLLGVGPLIERAAGQLRPVVEHQFGRHAALYAQSLQHLNDPRAR